MDIAALSIMLNQSKMQQQVGISVMKMAMGVAADQNNAITAISNDASTAMSASMQPYLGANIDIQV